MVNQVMMATIKLLTDDFTTTFYFQPDPKTINDFNLFFHGIFNNCQNQVLFFQLHVYNVMFRKLLHLPYMLTHHFPHILLHPRPLPLMTHPQTHQNLIHHVCLT